MSIPIKDDAYLLECARYIERNPLDAKLVEDLADYAYSSYLFYAEGKEGDLLTESPVFEQFGKNKEEQRTNYKFYVGQERPEIKKLTVPF